MKRINKILIAVVALCISGCTTESIVTLPVDVVWTSYLSTQNADICDENSLYVEPGDYLFLREVSQGALSHEWILDEKASFFTVVDDISSTIEDKILTDTDAYIVFEQSGWTTITMRNTFPEEVTSNTSSSYDSSITTYYDEEAEVWVFEKVWNDEVYGSLKPAFSVVRIELDGTETEVLAVSGDETTSTDNLTDVTLSQGDKLKFIYDSESEYKSSAQTWSVAGGTYNMSDDTYSFNTVGTYTGYTLTASRDKISDSANTINAASTTKVVPLQVNVEYANIAVVSTGIYQASDNSIIVPFSKTLKTPLDSDLASAFSLVFVGDDSSLSEIVTVDAVQVVEDDATSLQLTFDEAYFDNYDMSHALLSYTPATDANVYDGSVEDAEAIGGFADLSVSLYDILNEDHFNFNLPPEKTTNGYVFGGWWLNATEAVTSDNGSYIDSVVDPDDASGEDIAMRFYVNGQTDDSHANYIVLAYYEYSTGEEMIAGDYTMRGRVYVNEFVPLEGMTATAAMQIVLNNGSTVLCNVAVDNLETGKWFEFNEQVTIAEGTTFTNFRLQMQYSGSGSNVTNLDYTEFYIDDIYLSRGYSLE